MWLVTTGTTPHAVQTWKSAVSVPKAYFATRERSFTMTSSDPVGQEVQTPPCFTQNEHVQARAGISVGSGSQFSANAMLPQWQQPEISIGQFSVGWVERLRETRHWSCTTPEGFRFA